MPKNIRMDSTTLAEVLAQTSVQAKLNSLAAAMGTGTQTVSVKDGGVTEIFTGTFAGTAYTPTGVSFLPRTALGSTSGTGGTVGATDTVRITSAGGRWIEGEFGTLTGEVWELAKAFDATDTTFITLNLGGAGTQPPPTTVVSEAMSPRVWFDPNNAVETTGTPVRRQIRFTGHLAPNGPGINGRWDTSVSAANDPTPGLVDPQDGKSKFLRVANGSAWNYRVVMSKGQRLDFFDTHRLKFYPNFDDASTRIPYGEEVWIAYAFKTPSFIVGGGGSDNGTNGVHLVISTNDSGDSNFYQYFARGNVLSYNVRANPVLNSTSRSTAVDTPLGQSVTLPVSTWYHVVIRTRLNGVNVGNPFTVVWDKIGNGSIVQRGSMQGANAWNRSAGNDWGFVDGGQYFFTRNFGAGGAGDFSFATNNDPWTPPGSPSGVANGTDMVFDYAGLIVVPVANAGNATQTDFFDWLRVRTGAS